MGIVVHLYGQAAFRVLWRAESWMCCETEGLENKNILMGAMSRKKSVQRICNQDLFDLSYIHLERVINNNNIKLI